MSEEEKLLGDQVEEFLHKVGADKVAKAYEKVTGKDCGCKKRKERLNQLHQKLRRKNKKLLQSKA